VPEYRSVGKQYFMNRLFFLKAAVLLLAAAGGFGQTAPAGPTFEVATIKPAPPLTLAMIGSRSAHISTNIDNAIADFGGMSLTDLVARAYRVKSYQVSGPDWMNTARFDVLAKLPEGASKDAVPEMLQALLVDRFRLELHRDSKEFSVYAMVVAKHGSKLPAKATDMKMSNGLVAMTMDNFAVLLSNAADRPVVDRTGLTGDYMLSLQAVTRAGLTRELAKSAQRVAASGRTDGLAAALAEQAESGPDLFSAVPPGLKLEPRKLPMTLLVIDHLEKTPTAN